MNACPDVWLEGLQPVLEMFNRSVIISDETGIILFANSTMLLHLNKFTIRNSVVGRSALPWRLFGLTVKHECCNSRVPVIPLRWSLG